VQQMLTLMDEVISELRVAAGQDSFELGLVASTPPVPIDALLPPPTTAELAQRGIRFLDAAVSGTSAMAWKKDLIVIAGGAPEDFEACKPLFAGFSRAPFRQWNPIPA